MLPITLSFRVEFVSRYIRTISQCSQKSAGLASAAALNSGMNTIAEDFETKGGQKPSGGLV